MTSVLTKKKDIEKAERLLTVTKRKVKKLSKQSVFNRGSQDNEDLIKAQILVNHLKDVLKKKPKNKRKKK
jgi:hypothetical protein